MSDLTTFLENYLPKTGTSIEWKKLLVPKDLGKKFYWKLQMLGIYHDDIFWMDTNRNISDYMSWLTFAYDTKET